MYFGDERLVPPSDPDSNEGMVRRVLLDAVAARAIHPMYQPVDIEEAAQRYDRLVHAAPPIDIVHLGLGPDGHTASLFPGSPTLDEKERLVVVRRRRPAPTTPAHLHVPRDRPSARWWS